jgi:hypothetical protein
MQGHKEFIVWQKATDLAVAIYLRRSFEFRLESPESRILNPVFRGDFAPAGCIQ